MKRIMLLILFLYIFTILCDTQSQNGRKTGKEDVKPTVTFIELGSVNCIPCKAMQPVMKNIEKKYNGQVKVIFYDVWTEKHKPYAKKYGIRLIPTQVFLDDSGKEFHRHEGFYPEGEIDKVLSSRGLKIKNTKG